MAIFRNIHLSFWTDPKVDEEFTPEDKYFYLYILTNPHTNLVGCYEIGIKQMSRETGYSSETIERLLDRLENVHGVIRFSKSTKELFIENWSKYNWTSSSKLYNALEKESKLIKNKAFREEVKEKIYGIHRVSTDGGYPMDTTDTDTDTDNNSLNTEEDINIKFIDKVKDIIDYLNSTCGTHYKYSTQKTQTLIRARLNENFTPDDFKKVIRIKQKQWGNDPKMVNFLRPETLFGNKFESYLNQKETESKTVAEEVAGWI